MDRCCQELGLGPDTKNELIPSGLRSKVEDRTHWALTYLRQAELIKSSGRGKSSITPLGKQWLAKNLTEIRLSDLEGLDAFQEFRTRRKSTSNVVLEPPSEGASPDETLQEAAAQLRAALVKEVLDTLKTVSPSRFEWIILQLMQRLGYGGPQEDAAEVTGKSGDGGIDGVIKQDRLGLDTIYLQAKRYLDATVGVTELNEFVGALTARGSARGVLMTTSRFTEPAKALANRIQTVRLVLIDGVELAGLMVDHNLGVAVESVYEVKRLDSDFFDPMQ